jgi:hypothetical protein
MTEKQITIAVILIVLVPLVLWLCYKMAKSQHAKTVEHARGLTDSELEAEIMWAEADGSSAVAYHEERARRQMIQHWWR